MKAIFKLKSKPVSINNFYYANKAHGIKAEAKDWQFAIITQLRSDVNQAILKNLRDNFDAVKNGYKVSITYMAPAGTFYNKKGELSSRQIDLSNCEKSLIDLLFIPKYNGAYGMANLNIDDKWLMELSSKKSVSADADYHTHIQVEIIDLPKLA